MVEPLKSCPFCGGEGAFGESRYSKSHEAWWPDGSQILHAHFISCVNCGGSRRGIVGGQQTKAEAIAAWNTRAASEREAKLVEAAQDIADQIGFCEDIDEIPDDTSIELPNRSFNVGSIKRLRQALKGGNNAEG